MPCNETICDPPCGTGGFLLIAHEFIRNHNRLDKKQLTFLNTEQLRGVELVDSVARLCCMNLVLHGIGSDATDLPVMVQEALAGKQGEYEMVLTTPLFGKKSSVTIGNEVGDEEKQSLEVHRDDFWASTSKKQFNFPQHVFTILKQLATGRVRPSVDTAAPRSACGLVDGLIKYVNRTARLSQPYGRQNGRYRSRADSLGERRSGYSFLCK